MKRRRRKWPPAGKKFDKFCRKYLRMHLVKWWQVEVAIAFHKIQRGERPTLWQAVDRAVLMYKPPQQIERVYRNVMERMRARNRIARGKK